jgi:hypothetical protein
LLKGNPKEHLMNHAKKTDQKTDQRTASARDLLTLTVRTGVQAGVAEAATKLGREQRNKLG